MKIYKYEAFTDKAGMGNPAGVVFECDDLTEDEMQKSAEKIGFNETVFLLASKEADIKMRYFTPGHEMNLCGHATIAGVKALFEKEGMEIPFKVGTMIEIPRAALTANRIASRAEYFSFGTNDLTQMTFGYSRDDIASFLPVYLEKKILKVDPFQVLDQNGVGQLIEMAVDKGRSVRPDLKCGICGEHGGEPSSVKFCHKVGLNYVSCSPFRVPIARLAAAQAAVEEA